MNAHPLHCRVCNVPHGTEIRRSIPSPHNWMVATSDMFRSSMRNRAWRTWGPVVRAVVNHGTGMCEACAKTARPAV